MGWYKVLLILSGVLWLPLCMANVQEAATKHTYKSNLDDNKKQELAGVGVRVKKIGPIRAKVYSVGLYLDRAAAAAGLKQGGFGGADEKSLAGNKEFESKLIEGSFGKTLVLRMARDVGADKMVDALGESVRPRMKGGDAPALTSFQSILSEALQDGGARNNMIFKFDTAAALNKLSVSVDGTERGVIQSPTLVRALFSVYIDKDSVSPTLKNSVFKTLPSWLKP